MIEIEATIKEDGQMEEWAVACPECGVELKKQLPNDAGYTGCHFECHCKVDCDACEVFETKCCTQCREEKSLKIKAIK